jgi:AcrR family transcriptional regulator
MSTRQADKLPKRPGRRAGAAGESREAILRAARVLFARLGFRGTTMRAVAKRAGVDMALIHHFFGSKPKLFAASVELPIDPEQVTALLATRPTAPGEAMARYYLEHLFVERSESITAMLRAGLGDPGCVPALRGLIERTIISAAAQGLGGKDARLRAELAGALMVGLFVTRCIVGVEPLATASVDDVVALLAPALDALLRTPGAATRSKGDRP